MTSKPAFYEIVARYKWEAWKSLGDITKEEAMKIYIAELIKVNILMTHLDLIVLFIYLSIFN